MNGTISYCGNIFDFNGVNDLPLQAVKAYISVNPASSISSVIHFFAPGLRGTPAGSRYPFIIDVASYRGDNRYSTRETIRLMDNFGNFVDCYVSSQFANTTEIQNLSVFIDFIKDNGFIVKQIIDRHGIIDISTNRELQDLRNNLFNINSRVINLLADKSLDNYGTLLFGLNKFEPLCATLKRPDYIYFSKFKPTCIYGITTRDDLYDALSELLDIIEQSDLDQQTKSMCREIIESLKQQCRNKNISDTQLKHQVEGGINEIEGIIKRKNKLSKKIKDAIDKVRKTVRYLKFEAPIFGEYIDEEKAIILYLNNILNKNLMNESFSNNELYDVSKGEMKKEIEITYAHELFHLIHFNQSKTLSYKKGDYLDSVSIEGLAYYFESKYDERYRGGNFVAKIKSVMAFAPVSVYPYTGACYIRDKDLINSFGEVLWKSLQKKKNYPHLACHCLLQGTDDLEEIIKTY